MKVFIIFLLCIASLFATAQTIEQRNDFVGKIHLPQHSAITIETKIVPGKVLYILSLPKYHKGEYIGFSLLTVTAQQKDIIFVEIKKSDIVLFCDFYEQMIGYTTQKLYDKLMEIKNAKE